MPRKVRKADGRHVFKKIILKRSPRIVRSRSERIYGFFELRIRNLGIVELRIVVEKYEVPVPLFRTLTKMK
jgi:hypothetical protein